MSERVPDNRSNSQTKTIQTSSPTTEMGIAPVMDSHQLTPARILQLQSTLGNRAVQGLVQRMRNDSSVIQRAGGAGTATPTGGTAVTPTVPSITPAEQRKLDLEAERDIVVPALAVQALGEVREKVKQETTAYLKTDSKAKGIRESVTNKAIADVKSNIDADVTASANEKADAKKYAAQHAESSGAVGKALVAYAEELTTAKVADDNKTELEKKAKEGFELVVPKTKVALDIQKSKAAEEAKKKMDTYAKTLIKTYSGTSKLEIVRNAEQDNTFINTKVNVGTAGSEEIQKRHSLDGGLAFTAEYEKVYQDVLVAPMKKAALLKLGVGRREFRRSKELNEFRQKLKDSAREQARADIDSDIDTNSLTASKGEMTKQYYAMAAKTKAYASSKVSVDAVMGTEADAIVEKVVPKITTTEGLKQAGKTSAYDIARENAQATDKIKAAAVSGATLKATELLKEKKSEAINDARKLTKGDKEVAGSTPDAAKTAAINTGVKTEVTRDEIGKKAIKESVTADNLSSGFAKLGKLIDISTPNAGDASSFDVELKIPFASASGGGQAYFLFGFGGEAERESDELSVNTQITLGAGFQTFGFDANFRLGLFLEAKGKDTTNVMNLLSYGLYRQVPQSAAEYFWGQGGKSGESTRIEAEKWAMMIEEQDMSGDGSVDVGLLMKIAMEANAGVAEFSAELAYKRLSRYNKEVIAEKGKDAAGVKLPANLRGDSIGKGEIRNVVDAATEIEVKFGKDSVAFGLEGSMVFVRTGDDLRIRELSLEASGTVPSQFGEESGEFTRIASKISAACVGSGKNLIALLKKTANQESDKGKRAVGTALDSGSDALFMGDHFDQIGASLAEKIQGDETVNDTIRSWVTGDEMRSSASETVNKIGLSNALKFALSFEKKWNAAGVGGDWEVALEASQVKSMEVDAEIVKVAVEKSKRLGKIGLASKGGALSGSAEALGHEIA
ncbi:hypothetical protein OB236_18075 [Paenibacillus sp. WQ 127069]|uniref:EF-hand domain-containing protein n=1 Tax=Paenibacillus baimaensis TaxID=2982185 RepID=A0ABT2UH95_9BACL|nr:hypothetical protein [Paenibacillus sp. WQ 127069]MCU6794012.1 hypothetical protein [Paenibacillus sp. WQ 127069]